MESSSTAADFLMSGVEAIVGVGITEVVVVDGIVMVGVGVVVSLEGVIIGITSTNKKNIEIMYQHHDSECMFGDKQLYTYYTSL